MKYILSLLVFLFAIATTTASEPVLVTGDPCIIIKILENDQEAGKTQPYAVSIRVFNGKFSTTEELTNKSSNELLQEIATFLKDRYHGGEIYITDWQLHRSFSKAIQSYLKNYSPTAGFRFSSIVRW